MKAKILRITDQCLLALFMPGKHYYESAENPLPEDAKISRVFIERERPDQIALVLTSENFDEVPEGKLIPEIDTPFFRKLEA